MIALEIAQLPVALVDDGSQFFAGLLPRQSDAVLKERKSFQTVPLGIRGQWGRFGFCPGIIDPCYVSVALITGAEQIIAEQRRHLVELPLLRGSFLLHVADLLAQNTQIVVLRRGRYRTLCFERQRTENFINVCIDKARQPGNRIRLLRWGGKVYPSEISRCSKRQEDNKSDHRLPII